MQKPRERSMADAMPVLRLLHREGCDPSEENFVRFPPGGRELGGAVRPEAGAPLAQASGDATWANRQRPTDARYSRRQAITKRSAARRRPRTTARWRMCQAE
jgi:hypothetical protein